MLGTAILAAFVFYLLTQASGNYPKNLLLATLFGFGFGFLIPKGQVCFTSAFRDLWLVGRASTAKALRMYRSMEGQLHFGVVGFGNVLGATVLTLAWDSAVYPYMVQPFPRIDLVKEYGFAGALLLTGAFLLALHFWADWRQTIKTTILSRRAARG